jgi:lysozyme
MIMKHEGVRYEPYKDSIGLWTVGVGHLIGDGKSLPASYRRKFSHDEVMAMFDKDFDKHKKQAESNVPGFSKFDSMGQAALIDLTFNMGPGWPKKFKNTSKKLGEGDTEGAAAGLEQSKWYQQVKSRGPTIVNMVRNSKVSAEDGGMASGPSTGYPATLHGNEMIVPLDPNSILAELGKKSASMMENDSKQKMSSSGSDDMGKELMSMNQEFMNMLSSKLDNMIEKLATSNQTQSKLLKYSQA